jgi:hypothetical protein
MQQKRLKVIALFTADPWQSAMPVIRVHAPARYAGVEVLQGNRSDAIDLTVLERCDAIVIQRDFPRFPGCDSLIKQARLKKIPVIYECDDMILETPREHISHPAFIDHLFKILRAVTQSDGVVVSTKPLAQYFKAIHTNTHVFPNYLDDGIWRINKNSQNPAQGQPVKIGYMGGASHRPDLEMITPVLVALAEEHGQQVTFSFWGTEPPAPLMRLTQTTWQAMDVLDYTEFADRFSDCRADIWIAPLQNTQFNQYKSAIKFLEYAAVGGATVFSRVGPYTDVVREGRNGLLASDQDEWRRKLYLLIDDPQYRIKLASGAGQDLQKNGLLSDHYESWLDAYLKVLDARRIQTVATVEPAIQTILHISEQVEERVEGLKSENQHLKALSDKYFRISNSRTWKAIEGLRNLINRKKA